LVIEVGSTTLRFDRNVKVPMYARHAVAEVWVLDVSERLLHRYLSPNEGHYTIATTVPLAVRLSPYALESEIDLAPLAALLADSQV
jgi:hypothetical protein